jgi:excisionase family DNA binding protein
MVTRHEVTSRRPAFRSNGRSTIPVLMHGEVEIHMFEKVPPFAEPILLNLQQASAFLGMSKATLHSWAWLGKIPCVRFGRKRMFRRADLVLWVETHTYPATGKPFCDLQQSSSLSRRCFEDAQPDKKGGRHGRLQ